MNCPFCKHKATKVIDKRDNSETNSTRRRRECENCGKRFTTYERIEKVLLNVTKRDGRVEEFDREKMKIGILKAIKKRPISKEKLEEIVNNIENNLLQSDKTAVQTKDIGDMVLKELAQIDKLGALLFAAVYKEFNSLEDVQKELEKFSE